MFSAWIDGDSPSEQLQRGFLFDVKERNGKVLKEDFCLELLRNLLTVLQLWIDLFRCLDSKQFE